MLWCILDSLPVELVHIIFAYFWAHEILVTFSDVSPYVDAILVAYSSYQVDFQSILRCHFDLICNRLRPNQIVSLILSDYDDTPHLSKTFLSRFDIQSLTRLRSLTLKKVKTESLVLIVDSMNRFNQNCQLSLDDCDITSLISLQIPSQLNRLKIKHSNPLQYLDYLPMVGSHRTESSLAAFKHICANALQLQSLEVRWMGRYSNIASFFTLPQLTCVVLEIKCKYFQLKCAEISSLSEI